MTNLPICPIVEIKTGAAPKWVGLQTAAQSLCYAPDSWMKVKRFCLELSVDGDYKLIPLTDVNDGSIFLSMLAAYTWMKNNGI